jgi:hypothetical protein
MKGNGKKEKEVVMVNLLISIIIEEFNFKVFLLKV